MFVLNFVSGALNVKRKIVSMAREFVVIIYIFKLEVSFVASTTQYGDKFCICSSVHRNYRLKKSNKMQLYSYAYIYLLLNYSTCFGRPSRSSSGVHKIVVAASGTDNTI